MAQASTLALVLSSSPLNEQDKMVTLLTPGSGLLRAVAPGAAKIKQSFRLAAGIVHRGRIPLSPARGQGTGHAGQGRDQKKLLPGGVRGGKRLLFLPAGRDRAENHAARPARHAGVQPAESRAAGAGKRTGHGLAPAVFPGLAAARRGAAVQSPALLELRRRRPRPGLAAQRLPRAALRPLHVQRAAAARPRRIGLHPLDGPPCSRRKPEPGPAASPRRG